MRRHVWVISPGAGLALKMFVQRHRLLLVDDEESIVFVVSRYLAAHGFDVDSACTLEDAYALLEKSRYALVVADLRLTGQRGAEGLEMIEHVHRHWPGTRSVLLSAFSSPEIEADARSRGADAVLRKPMALPDLVQVVVGLIPGAH